MRRLSLKSAKPSAITRADRARHAGRWELAARLYRKVLDRNPRNPPIWIQYGHALKEHGQLADAESAYRQAIGYGPADAEAYLQLGHVLKLRGKTDQAAAAYLRSLLTESSLHDGALELAKLGWSDAHFAELDGMRQGWADDGRFHNADPPDIGGSLDALIGTIAAGSAWNPSDPDKPVEVEFYVGDKIVGSCRTRTFRHDVKTTGSAPGPGGFGTKLRIDLSENAAIEVRARLAETGQQLINSPRTSALPERVDG